MVIDEVRVLSLRTQDSTQQIQSTIETLQQTTARAVDLMQTSQRLADNSVQDADQAVPTLTAITGAISLISEMAEQTAIAMRDLEQAHSLKAVRQP